MRRPSHRVRAPDGWSLDVLDLEPAGPPRALVIAGHAMMVDRRTYRPGPPTSLAAPARPDLAGRPGRPDLAGRPGHPDLAGRPGHPDLAGRPGHPDLAGRPGLAPALVDAGFRVLLPDLRGHGRSGPTPREGGDWSYDELVADTGVYVELARRLAPGLPVVLLGHSLFAHTSLAWLGQHPDAPVAAHVALAMDVWMRACEPSRPRWLLKRATMAVAAGVTALAGYFPAARLGLGSMDEARGYWADISRGVRVDGWRGRDGVDYHAGLAAIRCPCLHVVSAGDRLLAHPAAALRLTAAIPGRTAWQLGTDAAFADLRPDHMGLLTGPSAPLWRAIAEWLQQQVDPLTPPAAP